MARPYESRKTDIAENDTTRAPFSACLCGPLCLCGELKVQRVNRRDAEERRDMTSELGPRRTGEAHHGAEHRGYERVFLAFGGNDVGANNGECPAGFDDFSTSHKDLAFRGT